MKKIVLALSLLVISLTILSSCAQEKTVPYVELKKYFLKNDVDASQLKNPVIDSKQRFDAMFGEARVMGSDGGATVVDFDKQFVIVVAKDTTNIQTELSPISLTKKDDLTFKYSVKEGAKQTFTTRPLLLIAVDNKYKEDVKLEETK